MSDKGLEILSQVMMSLKVKQTKSMNNIKALIANSVKETDVIDKIEDELGIMSDIESKMQQCEGFMLQFASAKLKSETGVKDDGEFNEDKHSDK